MGEDIYGTSVQYLQGKTVHHKIQHVKPIIIKNNPRKTLIYTRNVTLCCDLMYINGIGFLNTTSQHIMFATGSMDKNRKLKNIDNVIKRVHKLYLQRGLKTTCIDAAIGFEPL